MNEPAFPRSAFFHENHGFGGDHSAQDGMTLRDYFAAKAMQASIARLGPIVKVERTGTFCLGEDAYEVLPQNPAVSEEAGRQIRNALAEMSYQYADAMLKERSK